MMKAAGGGLRPRWVPDRRYDQIRRYSRTHSGILDDQTPHLEPSLLRRLADKNLVIQAVLFTLVNQIVAHFREPAHENAIGMRVVQRDRQKELTEPAANEAKRIELILRHGGILRENPITGEPAVWDSHDRRKADSFDTCLRKVILDMLVIDRIFISIEGSIPIAGKRDNPVMFFAAEDGALMRKVDSQEYVPKMRPDLAGQIVYAMLDPTSYWGVVREYKWDEGDMGIRNPRTDFASFGYGKSEVQQCLDAVLGVIYAVRHNKDYFTDSHIPFGILNLIGHYGKDQLDGLQQLLTQDVGFMVGGEYKFPVLRTPPGQGVSGAQWVQMMDRARMDMVFRAYIEFCVALTAAVFQIAPEEFGFSGFGGPSSALQMPDPESTFMQSQHKGLIPKVLFLCQFFSKNVVTKINPDFELVVQGLESNYDPAYLLEQQLDAERLANGYTMNQIRTLRDLPPVYDPKDIVLWNAIRKQYTKRWFATEEARQEAVLKTYSDMGGELGDYADAPAGNPGMLQIWASDHNLGAAQQAQGEMGQMAQSQSDADNQMQQANQQGAQQQMQQMADNEQQMQLQRQNAQADDREASVMRIPMAEDASLLRQKQEEARPAGRSGKPGKPGKPKKPFGKSFEAGVAAGYNLHRCTVRISPRDE